MAAFEVIALDTATPQLRAPGASDTYTFPRAVEMPLGTANGVLFLNGSKVVTSGSALTFDGTNFAVGTSSPSAKLDVTGIANSLQARFGSIAGRGLEISTALVSGTTDAGSVLNAKGAAAGTFIFQTDSTEQMRLTSTGLGIGTSSPGAKLQILAIGKATIFGSATAQNSYSAWQYNGADVGYIGNAAGVVGVAGATDFGITAFTGGKLWLGANNGTGTTYAVLDSSGNLGLGVTPSAWGSNYKAFELAGASAGVVSAYVNNLNFGTNIRNDNTNWIYTFTGQNATRYEMTGGGQHRWFTAPSGTAGNAISFTQAMTLDASGNLGIGLSSPLVKLHIADPTSATVRVTSIGNANFDMTCSATQAIIGSPNGIPLLFNTSNTERLRLKSTGQLRYVPLSSDPAGAENGDVYYNSTTNKLRLYAAGAWVDLN